MRRSPWIALLVVVLALAGGAARWSGRDAGGGGGAGADGEVLAGGRTARVVRVVDGDTIRVRLDRSGGTERIRYIGIDTPESVKPGTPVQCYAKAASHANQRLVGGRRVRLEGDVEPRDRYGRLLAYVWVAGAGTDPERSVNAALVRDGDAQTLTIPPNVRHAGLFRRLAADARRAGRGLWARCGGEYHDRRVAQRLRQSQASFEEAFAEQAEEERQRAEELRRRALQRTAARRRERRHKRGSMRFGLLVLILLGTAVLVTVAMFQALYLVMG